MRPSFTTSKDSKVSVFEGVETREAGFEGFWELTCSALATFTFVEETFGEAASAEA